MAEETDAAARNSAAAFDDEVKPYKIHVSSKYLELTRQKLELTRLPHEASEPQSDDWWEPKPQVEPLIDFWLEKYSWRDQEEVLNQIPQFRTSICIPGSETPLRLHFVHFRSPHSNAIPLLLIPAFPFTNLSFGHLVKPFTDPQDGAAGQPFHLVIPSLPGLGFSDAFPNNVPVISATAELLNTMMARLSYSHYLATNASAASASPAEIDWRLINYLASHYSSSCVGAHFVSPPLASPKIRQDPWEWTKWSLASLLHTGIFGYSDDDFTALDRLDLTASGAPPSSTRKQSKAPSPADLGLNRLDLREPNTLAYALCDSPTGLLLYVMKGLALLSPRVNFTPEQTINTTQLAWLPGPEYAMRFWAYCAEHRDDEQDKDKSRKTTKPRVAITVFVGESLLASVNDTAEGAASTRSPQSPFQDITKEHYVCPAWANARYNVAFAQRVSGRAGLLAWERPEVLTAGVRGLAREVMRVDSRLSATAEPVATAPLEQVIVSDPEGREIGTTAGEATAETAEGSRDVEPAAASPSDQPAALPSDDGTHLREPQIGERAISDDTIAVQVDEDQDIKDKDKDLLKPDASAQPAGGSSNSLVAERKAKAGQGPSDETIVAGTPPASL